MDQVYRCQLGLGDYPWVDLKFSIIESFKENILFKISTHSVLFPIELSEMVHLFKPSMYFEKKRMRLLLSL